jgi:transcription-repair coupling factor (superfamily II helicase)
MAHGQMRERELEKIMSDFYHHRFNVLICSTIIETGIDIPSANTIIINRADKFGLAQLHQLRGRVGRSHHQAYAYLLVPSLTALTPDAQKRLEAIVKHEDLGIGFTLAIHDLEIRGAGELLGDNQSGNIEEVGFSLFNEMLENAIYALKKGGSSDDVIPKPHTEIKCAITTLIPETFMPDVNMRLQYYKRLASAPDKNHLDDIQAEITDCYGTIPPELSNLLRVTHLKLIAQSVGIVKIELTTTHGRFDFNDKSSVNPVSLVRLIQSKPTQYKMNGPQRLRFEFGNTEDDQITWVENLIKKIM